MRKRINGAISLLLAFTACFSFTGSFAAYKKPETRTATVSVVGDVMALNTQLNAADRGKSGYDFDDWFKFIAPTIKRADISIANLETPITKGRKEIKGLGYPNFNAPASLIGGLKNAGFDVLCTANNHCLDRGKKGAIDTIKNIKKYKLKYVGTNLTPTARSKPLIMEANGIKFGILAYTTITNQQDRKLSSAERNYVVNMLKMDKIQQDVKAAKKAGADIIIALTHWGVENTTKTTSQVRSYAKDMIKCGVDVIFGSHPHVPQPIEVIKTGGADGKARKGFVIYSLGNFVSNMARYENNIALVLQLRFQKKAGNTKLLRAHYVPTYTYRGKNARGTRAFWVMPVGKTINNEAMLYKIKGQGKKELKAAWGRLTRIVGKKYAVPIGGY